MPKCTINGKDIEVAPGTSVIQAFKQAGEDIAHYCWHPGLSVAGCCRMCVCDIQGNPRPQIACNTAVTEGMVVTNKTAKVKEAVKWVLQFHLINHPLDCPICDQAGECGLQEYFMAHGQYDPSMHEKKVKKQKVQSLGPQVMLDSERCILCSRCVRFTDEVTKTKELGIFNRGDHSEVGTHAGKPLNNKYSQNVVDICPVGALTSQDFRFRQRVWFLNSFDSICTGCSTGCNVKIYHNENGFYRVKPNYNEEVNGHWMCDEGRDVYKFLNKEHRLLKARVSGREQDALLAGELAGSRIKEIATQSGADSVALVLTAQYTNEEYQAILEWFTKEIGSQKVYHWINNAATFEDFDGLLIRGDKNPNTVGLLKALEARGIRTQFSDFATNASAGKFKAVVVAGPENQRVYPDMTEKMSLVQKCGYSIWLGAGSNEGFAHISTALPTKSFVEKSGTFVNFKGISQSVKAQVTVVPDSLSLDEWAKVFKGERLEKPRNPSRETVSPLEI